MDLGLDVNLTDDVPVVAVRGEVDFGTAPRLRELLITTAMDGHRHVVADLRGVEFLDSTGLGVLVGALKRYRTLGGDLHLVISTSRIRSVFELTGLTSAFHIHDTVGSAVEAARLAG
jgi:anti-sigma B factor antagonist